MILRSALSTLRHSACALGTIACFAAAPQAARAADILVVTSFPSSLYEPFRRAFEAREPGIRLRIMNRKTTAAISMVADERIEQADIFWASAPDSFEVLAAKDQFLPLSRRSPLAQPRIGRFPVDDPEGFFRGFTVSGYGVTWNRALLEQAGLQAPASIAELVDSRFRGLIAMSSPSRSGTTHLMVETILQRQGWRAGWETWLAIAGNLATVTARSFSVSTGVANGRFAIGLSIDFLGRRQDETGIVDFAYPRENVFLPGSIAVLRSSRQPEQARRFVDFVLGEHGQRLLMNPQIGRFPVSPPDGSWPEPDLFTLAKAKGDDFLFDAGLSGRRYELVNILFDELITERLSRLKRFWRLHAEAGARIKGRADLEAAHAEAGRLARTLPDGVAMIGDGAPVPDLKRIARGAPVPAEQAIFIERIRADLDAQLLTAERRLEALVALLSNGEPSLKGVQP